MREKNVEKLKKKNSPIRMTLIVAIVYPDQPRASNTVSITGRRFHREKAFLCISLFLSSHVPGTPRHVCTVYRAQNRISDLRMFNIKHDTSPKMNCILKLGNYETVPRIFALSAQNSERPRRFFFR